MAAVPPALDAPCGRVMGDVSSMFVVYLLEWHQWRPDGPELVRSLWPAARAAAKWQVDRAARLGLPEFLVDSYECVPMAAPSHKGARVSPVSPCYALQL